MAKMLGCARFFVRPAGTAPGLGVAPGGATSFAPISDCAHRVQPLLNRAMLACARLNYHSLTNAATTAIVAADLLRFVEACAHEPRILDLEATGIAWLDRRPRVGIRVRCPMYA